MEKIKNYFNNSHTLEIGISIILFGIAVYLDRLMDFIIYMLYFIIFLEIVRAVISYVVDHTVDIRFLVDAFIILTLREFIVNIVKINKEDICTFNDLMNSSLNLDLMVLSGAILFLFFVRYLTIKTNPVLPNKEKE
jgi:uncharacterized membrane protein (DUF373 family)